MTVSKNRHPFAVVQAVCFLVTATIGTLLLGAQPPEQFTLLLSQYNKLKSVHFQATTRIERFDSRSRPMPVLTAIYRYWGSGSLYRIYFWEDPDVIPGIEFDVAYDGHRKQTLRMQDQVLEYVKSDDRITATSPPNPLFLAVDFLSACDDRHLGQLLRLVDVQEPNASIRLAQLAPIASIAAPNSSDAVKCFRLGSGVQDGRAFHVEVEFADAPTQPAVPRTVRRVAADGKPIQTIRFGEPKRLYGAGVQLDVAQRITQEFFDEGGKLTQRDETHFDEVEVNEPISDEQFTIDFKDAASVWDGDAKVFVKSGGIASPSVRSIPVASSTPAMPADSSVAVDNGDDRHVIRIICWCAGCSLLFLAVAVVWQQRRAIGRL